MIKNIPTKKFRTLSARNCYSMLILLLLVVVYPLFKDAQAKEIVRTDPLSAHVSDSFQCEETIELLVNAPNSSYFSKGNMRFQRMVSMAALTLGFQCPKITTFKVIGMVGASRVYDGHAKKNNRWILVDGPPPDPMAVFRKQPLDPGEKRSIGLPKVTESKELEHSKKIEPFFVLVHKGPVTPQGKTFQASVSGPNVGIFFPNSANELCSELMSVDIMVRPNAFNYDKFRQTHKGSDLPLEVLHPLYLMRDLLLEQCGQLKAMRFKFYSMDPREKDLNYTGTLSSDNGWVIQDGLVSTSYDSTRKIHLQFRDPSFAAGIDHQCSCEKNPILPLLQVNKTNQTKAWPEDIKTSMPDYTTVAKLIAKKYLSECPGTETISFSIDPIPEEYICDGNLPCYLTLSEKNPSTVMTDQFKAKPNEPELNDFNDVINAFALGNYKVLDQYTGYVRHFHNDFLEVFSDFCTANIKNPVIRDIKTIETRYDSEGFEESKSQVGRTYRVLIDQQYVDRFDSFWGPNKAWGVNLMMKRAMKQMTVKGRSGSMVKGVQAFISDRNLIKNFLATNKCQGEKVLLVYENLDRYFRHKPPLTLDQVNSHPTEKKQVASPLDVNETKPSTARILVSGGSPVDNQPAGIINLQESFKAKFPNELTISVQVYDFLLARFYPDLLSQRMLEAMLSSRWVYERSQKIPLGGRFFNPDSRPTYADIRGVIQEYREWLISRAAALPEELVIDVPLRYGQNTMSVNDKCIQLIMPEGSAVRVSQEEKEEADRKLRKCEDRNRNLKSLFESCERARKDLAQAKQKLAQANKAGCVQNSFDNSGETNSLDGPCDFSNLTKANMKAEMKKCLFTACGTPSANTDMIAFQKCAQAVSEQFRNEIGRQMGQAPRQQATREENSCEAAEKEIQATEQYLAQSGCDLISQKPELFDCTSKGLAEQPDYMQVERIELYQMHNCIAIDSAYNRRSKFSADLLPSTQPYTDTRFGFALFIDKLSLPYDLPVPDKGQWTDVNARIKLTIKAADTSLNSSEKFGLAAKVQSINFN